MEGKKGKNEGRSRDEELKRRETTKEGGWSGSRKRVAEKVGA